MPNLTRLEELVKTFDRNRTAYLSGKFNEAQVRVQFINPFFELLGWDVNNKKGYAESYKDVYHEDAVSIKGATKVPDYAFRIGGTRKFFLEAKKPSINIKGDPGPAFQLRRYGWSAKLPLSILTDFEEFAVYDCSVKPNQKDKSSKARTIYWTYDEYVDNWDEISSIFSREAVLKGSFDKYADSQKAKRGTAEVDNAFLNEIEGWRDSLARNLALRNPALTQHELNFSVLRIIDRIIFLRMCEDREIEPYGQLQSLLNGTQVYPRLTQYFRSADDKYNSGLFHFKNEKSRPTEPDELTLGLRIDDKILKDIFRTVYYPESPYEFSVFPSEILGQVYEQFLGKVITLTKGHKAKIEEKPEVKKAGGVYYTPKYIVDYIVEQTIGKLLEGKKPGSRAVKDLKVLDPACGSGSFLLGAYQYILTWYRDQYVKAGPEKHKKVLYQAQGGEWRLTTTERKRILLQHIYGVDIDIQAVETSKLSLLLKVLEGESGETLKRQLALFKERALPDLGDNIKCGNSLIGPDFYDGQQMNIFDEEEQYRINVFDWQAEFPEIMKTGGFDAVIGNPPYVQISMEKKSKIRFGNYLIKSYKSSMGRLNTFGFFVKHGIDHLLGGGKLGFILPNTILTQGSYEELRVMILESCLIDSILSFEELPFKDAVVENTVLVLRKSRGEQKENDVQISHVNERFKIVVRRRTTQRLFKENYKSSFNIRIDEKLLILKKKLGVHTEMIGSFLNINQGIALKHDRAKYLGDKKKSAQYKPVLDGRHINRYSLTWDGNFLKYEIAAIHSCKREDIFLSKEKLLFRRVGDRLIATYDDGQFYALNTLVVMNLKVDSDCKIKYFLGLFNSRLLNFYYQAFLKSTKKVFSEIQARQISQLPIKNIKFSTSKSKAMHDKIIVFVDQMLSLKARLADTKTGHDKTVLQRQIDATDKQIDRLVYELYDLTDEEIKIVEESVGVGGLLNQPEILHFVQNDSG